MKVGLALSGGGARGIAHLGVIEALEKMGIEVSLISGTSAGAIVGAFYCSGMSTGEILDIYIKEKFFKFARPSFAKGGLLSSDKLKKFYLKYLPTRTFEELNIPLVVTATNITHGTSVHFREGDLIQAVLASSTIPIVFNPMTFDDKKFVDGGLLNNLPVEPIRKECHHIIGVHVNPIAEYSEANSVMSLIERSLSLALSVNAHQSMKLCDIAIEPKDLAQFSTTDISKAREIFEIGYHETQKYKAEILALFEN